MLPLSRTPDGAAWAPLVARALVARGDVEHAAVLDAEDGAVYASTTDFGPRIYMMGVAHEDGSEEEEEEELINEAIDIRTLVIDGKRPQRGLRINGEKYVILKASREAGDPSRAARTLVYGKKRAGGCCLAGSEKTIVVATFDENEGHAAGGCNRAVEELAAYLASSGS